MHKPMCFCIRSLGLSSCSQGAVLELQGLIGHAEKQGLRVHWDPFLAVQGRWFEPLGLIVLRDGMTMRRTRSVLAHELGHARYGDWCASPGAERRAWRHAAGLLIDPVEFAVATRVYGPHAGEIARHLDVLADVVHAHWVQIAA